LSHTIPGPPPGACAIFAVEVFADFAGAEAVEALAAGAAGAGWLPVLADGLLELLVEDLLELAVLDFPAVPLSAAAAGAEELAAYHSLTPWCPRQAPLLLADVV